MTSCGLCIGASTLSLVKLVQESDGTVSVAHVVRRVHGGNPKDELLKLLNQESLDTFSKIAVTGRKFRRLMNLSLLSEPEAVETAYLELYGKNRVNAIVSAGGETFMVYRLGRDGRISSVQTGNKCASGTGEFFLQQIRRMGITLDDAARFARTAEPYKVSGRCSVFCKSDCTHATNKGISRERVAAGLCQMMAAKVVELLKRVPKRDIMIVGGCAQNSVMIEYVKENISNLIIPKEALYFEALGCALWALNHETKPVKRIEDIFRSEKTQFPTLPPLKEYGGMVEFKSAAHGILSDGDRCIVGLDVGSTTTKAVIVKETDNSSIESVYLRTNGDPVGASRECYARLIKQLGRFSETIHIVGLGVTGSGRQVAGLHAMTDGIINEIIAHATGALYFDKNVDTIFEIGGQDAKYTYITNGVPSDYAMNEACSAGTGSFLEEAAKETLDIEMENIADIALRGEMPPNFNDQCAAFISSDIKNAFHEGVAREDIVAGLVYSICMNYSNRVRGTRPVGEKVFMQGGVCYNRAVPLAMASLTGKHIVVPPDPGLIGAFGVALEVKHRLVLGLMKEKSFSLCQLRDRELEYGPSFICNGGREKCDRKCEIARIRIEDKIYPFGGACNRWYNLRSHDKVKAEGKNLVTHYEALVFEKYITVPAKYRGTGSPATVGINKSFLVNTYFPLYFHFFSHLGFEVILSDNPRQEGMDRKNAPFCYPAEIAHGYFFDLLGKMPDYLFLPQIKSDFVKDSNEKGLMCPLSQGEPFYLMSAYRDCGVLRRVKEGGRILMPSIDFSDGCAAAEDTFVDLGKILGRGKQASRTAYRSAVKVQQRVFDEIEGAGREALKHLDRNPEEFAVVIFGRAYNAFVAEANMGIAQKFASRSIPVVPFVYLPETEAAGRDNMYWSAGQRILKGAHYVRKHPQLFACYITNFSCGPDSFLIGYFRDLMGKKPSLTLELDSHVADAGLETRIEAFLDIIRRYRELEKERKIREESRRFMPARITAGDGLPEFVDSEGRSHALTDSSVHLVFPSMGRFIPEAGAAVFRGLGIRSSALPPADDEALKLGRGYTSCKECLPLQLTVGSLMKYLYGRQNNGEKLVYFMPTAAGPCRYGQYSVFMEDLIEKRKLEDVALLSSSAENSYEDMSRKNLREQLWTAVVLSDIFEEIYSALMTNAVDIDEARAIFENEWVRVLTLLGRPVSLHEMKRRLGAVASVLSAIEVKRSLVDTPTVLLTGEIYVRHDGISRQYLVEDLARRGFATKVSTVAEWIYYTGWCVRNNVSTGSNTLWEKISLSLRHIFMRKYERTFRTIMARSSLCRNKTEDVDHIIRHTQHLINPELVGEAILTTGAGINEILDYYCGVIAIGPFGCMPNRLAEALLTPEMTMEGKVATGTQSPIVGRLRHTIQDLPFLAIESDGNRFPQVIEAKLEAFLLQVARVHEALVT